MKKSIFFIVLFALSFHVHAQYSFAIDGYIKDQNTGDAISGARVSIDKGGVETFTNRYGYYSISVPANQIVLTVEYQGFLTVRNTLNIEKDQQINFSLKHNLVDNLTNFESLVASQNVLTDPQSSKIDIPIGTLKQIPYLFSENDVVKGLQMFPGVAFGPDGTSDLFVRGGEAGQNLMLLDGTPVYSQGHFFGYISNFNTAVVNNIQIYKGAFPARYGGRISSVIDVTSNSGNSEEVRGSLTISPILANINISLPVDKKGSGLSFAGRRSYIDILLAPALGTDIIRFGDFQTKLDLKLNPKNSLTLSYYNLNDNINFTFDETDSNTSLSYEFGLKDINRTATVRWNSNQSKRLFSSVSASYSGFKHLENIKETNLKPLPGNPTRVLNDVIFSMSDLSLNGDLEYNYSNKNFLRFGMQNIVHMFLPGLLTQEKRDNINTLMSHEKFGDSTVRKSMEIALYIEDEVRFDELLKVNFGYRNVIYAHSNKVAVYPEPRISGRQKIDSISSFKFSAMRVNQFVHLYNNGSLESEVVVYIPADDVLKPEVSNQLSIGYARQIKSKVEWQWDAYYKTLDNQILFYNIDYFDKDAFSRNALIGKGTSYGLENFIKYNYLDFSAWFSYDISVSKRIFDDLNRGESFFYDYDRRHTFKTSFVMSFDQWIFSSNIVFASGNPFTLPNAKYRDIDGRLVLSYDEINNYRSKTYFRTDIKLQYFWGLSEDFNHSFELTIYNLTANPNISNIYSELDRDFPNQKYRAMKVSNFLFMPSVSYKLTI